MGYLLVRAALGAALNPPLNGPDESAHVEYVRSLALHGLRGVTGVEARQPPLFYALAAIPWQLATGQPEHTRAFVVRLLSAICGVGTLALTWRIAVTIWPGHQLRAALAAMLTLAPGHLFVLASVNNDPLASALSALVVLAALKLCLAPASWPRGALLAAAALAALATKLTAMPVVFGVAIAIVYCYRAVLRASRLAVAVAGVGAVAGLAAYIWLLSISPTTSALAAAARFGPLAIVRGPLAYFTRGGFIESFRTWWYGYDYLVRWPAAVEAPLAVSAALVSLVAVWGLLIGWRSARLPAIVWLAALAQAVFVLSRYGFGDLLSIEMGGAAQAKAFFSALAPLAVVFAAGLTGAAQRLGLSDRCLTIGMFVWLLALDAVSLSVTLWHHYRWWQIGV